MSQELIWSLIFSQHFALCLNRTLISPNTLYWEKKLYCESYILFDILIVYCILPVIKKKIHKRHMTIYSLFWTSWICYWILVYPKGSYVITSVSLSLVRLCSVFKYFRDSPILDLLFWKQVLCMASSVRPSIHQSSVTCRYQIFVKFLFEVGGQ